MDLEPEYSGYMERYLDWIVLARIFAMLFFPLFAAFIFHSIIIKVICWAITAVIFFSSLSAWGYSVISILVGLVPLYVYFEWEKAATWLAYLACIVIILQFSFIKKRIKEIRALNREFNANNQT